MSSSDEETALSSMNIKLRVLEGRRSALFARMQVIYNKAKTAHLNDNNKESFLIAVETVNEVRSEFKSTVDKYNTVLLTTNPKAQPDYQTWTSFEELYSYVRRVISQVLPQKQTDSETKYSPPPPRSRPSLPPIELITFSGDIRAWPLFYASFKATVHDNPSLTDDEKLYYLVGKLSNKAQSVFSGITPSGNNYTAILQSLIDRYQDTRTLASMYIDEILNTKPFGSASLANFELFMDKICTAANALQNLGLDNLGDYLLFHIALKKLDADTVRAFEMESYAKQNKTPTLQSLINFIKMQYKISLQTQNDKCFNQSSKPRKNNNVNLPNPQSYMTVSTNEKCLCINIVHEHLYKCPAFISLSPGERFKIVKEKCSCVNCLSIKHKSMNCKSNSKCRTCNGKHHTLLHFDNNKVVQNTASSSAQSVNASNTCSAPAPVILENISAPSNATVSTCSSFIAAPLTLASYNSRGVSQQCTVLLATAQVLIYDRNNVPVIIRCLIDNGSQSHFITKDLCNRLGLKGSRSQLIIKGIGGTEKSIRGSVELKLYSRYNSSVSYDISALIVDHIADDLPTVPVDATALANLLRLPLADDNFATPGQIEMLIGASLFSHLLLPGMVTCNNNNNLPSAVETTLGYIIMGTVPILQPRCISNNITTSCCAVVRDPMDALLKRFWELEEVDSSAFPSQDDVECEEHFQATTTRDINSGRYTVSLPFRGDIYTLGETYAAAHRRFLCLERKLEASLKMRIAYDSVIKEYVDKGYLSVVPNPDDHISRPAYYIPHHGVIREDKVSTKLRVVLDASSGNPSLNDLLHSGPNLQGDLFSIILKFRLFAIALSADCRQQFLQIGMNPSDRRFQRILYRFSPHDPITVYEFSRVCFGLKSSPFHALRVVHQLIEDEGYKFNNISAILSSLYMDDINFSVRSEADAIAASTELIKLFKAGQFDLVKWASNNEIVLKNIPASHRASSSIEFDKSVPHKILGLRWDKANDCFCFEVASPGDQCTKRTILSTVARLWDIMGFVAPTVLFAKLLIKELWLMKCDWDDTPPRHIVAAWAQFCSHLFMLNEVRIPRHVGIVKGSTVNLVGFADASERAYGGVAYIHVQNCTGNLVHIICAKSKVSPSKPISIARLELLAAVLLSRLLRKVFDALNPQYKINKIFAFTDSKVVLHWINSSPHRWQTFVANRVVTLTDNLPANCFYHVAGLENPADCLSRGLTPDKQIDHALWFHGPTWLSLDPTEWSLKTFDGNYVDDVPEQKSHVYSVTVDATDSIIYQLALRTSSYPKLLRIIAHIYKFLKILTRANLICSADLEFAETKLLCVLQNVHFSRDVNDLKNNRGCSPALMKLKPFLDTDGLIRVGGRLTNSAEEYDYKHPIVLPRQDHIINLLIDYHHGRRFHAGLELLMSLLRQRFWILSARRVIRQRIFKCNICFRYKPRPTYPLMADLPSQRINQVEKAFTHCGVDYMGPLQCTPCRGRGVKSRKTWLCI